MKIYNTLTRELEELKPVEEGVVKIYSCGPTVYNYIHIGNARPICVFDVLRRYLEYRGWKVRFVQNYTDVDDKIIRKANEEGVSSTDVSERYIKEYQTDAKGLNVRPADVHPQVTKSMGMIIKFVKGLVDSGHAYVSDGDVYFQVNTFPEYGKLSHMPLEDLQAGARIDSHEQKKDPMDFALWKAAKPGEPYWDSPWGKGRPGWHIECSAMAKNYLADTIDIHCGGQDLIFPHHENEIAQSECGNGKEFAHYWMHNGYINVDNRKMSKSLGNFFTVREVAEKFGYEPIRLLMLQAHYRSQINYNMEIMEQCKASLDRLYTCKESVAYALGHAPEGEMTAEQEAQLNGFKQQFNDAMDNDLNTADAITAVYELVRYLNPMITGADLPSRGFLTAAQKLFNELCDVLGILYEQREEPVPEEILALVEERNEARKQKNYAKADELRDEIASRGYILEETRQGTKIKKK